MLNANDHTMEKYRPVYNEYIDAYREYMMHLTQNHPDYMTFKELKGKDRIDIRPIFPNKTKDPGLRPLIKAKPEYKIPIPEKQTFFNLIPCFKEGVFHHNENQYVYWLIKDINTDEQTIDILLQYYNKEPYQIWQPTASGIITCEIDKNNSAEINVYVKNPSTLKMELDMPLIYSTNDLSWTPTKKDIWQNTNQKLYSIKKHKDQHYAFIKNTCVFLEYTCLVNYLLSQQKVKTQTPKTGTKIKSKYDAETDIKVKKRTLGILNITSVRPPKRANAKIIRTYRLPSWKTRGHIRHYKSGKTVYIKECTHHRKQLKQTDIVPQTIIKLKEES